MHDDQQEQADLVRCTLGGRTLPGPGPGAGPPPTRPGSGSDWG